MKWQKDVDTRRRSLRRIVDRRRIVGRLRDINRLAVAVGVRSKVPAVMTTAIMPAYPVPAMTFVVPSPMSMFVPGDGCRHV